MSTKRLVTKILVAGPVGSGKTTFVRTLSESAVVNTDVAASEKIGKLATTVGIDFGSLNVDHLHILLFGVPGQERFDFMWDVACSGSHALVLLIAADRPACFIESKKVLRFLRERISVPVVIGLTRSDVGEDWDHAEVGAYLGVTPECVVKIDARNKESCMQALHILFEYVSPNDDSAVSEASLSLV